MPKKPDDIIRLALERFDESETYESTNRANFIDDAKFAILGEQWTDEAKRARKGRIQLTENRLPTFIAQVVGDQLQNNPRIKARPVDSKGDPAVAEVFTGLIRNIENISQADSIRSYAFKQAVTSGWGYYGIHTRYADDMSFDQEIYHRFIPNPLSVYDDPHAKLPDKSDRRWLIVTDTLSKDEFKSRYPKAKVDGFAEGQGDLDWFGEDANRIGEYWYVESVSKKIALLSDGKVIESKDFVEGSLDVNGQPITIAKERTTEVDQVYSCIISGNEVLEGPIEWAGKYIAFVYVSGKQDNIEGKTYTTSLVRWAKDPQRMHNYWLTTTTEIVALQPKVPWLVTPNQIDGHEQLWSNAHSSTLPYLTYNPGPEGPPTREALNNLPQGTFTMMQQSIDGIKATMGIFDASLGNRGNETSGKAIIARQKEGDTATYEFVDNLHKALAFEGKVLVDLIPKIYDTAKIVRIINPDDSEKMIMVNQPMQGEDFKKYGVNKKATEGTIYDLNVGKYDVVIETGPSYSTQRQEAADSMTAVIQAAPKIMDIAGDIYFKNQDWPGAQDISTRLKKTLPPGLAEPDENAPPTPPPPQQQPTPQEQIDMQKLALEGEKLNVEKMKLLMDTQDKKKEMRQVALDTIQEVFTHQDHNVQG